MEMVSEKGGGGRSAGGEWQCRALPPGGCIPLDFLSDTGYAHT